MIRRPPALEPEAYDTLVSEVLERALSLTVEDLGDGAFCVTGGWEPHWVHLYDPQIPRCDCLDLEVRRRLCKHLVAVLMYLGDRQLWVRIEGLEATRATP